RLNADFVVLELNHIYERQIKKDHKKGIKVYIFTINTKKELEKVKQLGIDGIFTDNPGRFRH
ncbi:glycerophosphodiester phosphodiesterase, partial [Candidatus Saccharibacteria bacterium]|nr:glycerophosphodiester phosphodiesterase [Candidatus Saccharibacteria bacterium]